MKNLISGEIVEQRIFLFRGKKVMFDSHLSVLYGVQTKVLIQAIKRNKERFPEDFMFQLSWEEVESSRSQIVTLKRGQNIKYRPYVFTEQGVAMLSSVLRSRKAIQANIVIMRTFVKLREALAAHKELSHKLNELERKVGEHDIEIQAIFKAIRELMAPSPEKPKRQIGFIVS